MKPNPSNPILIKRSTAGSEQRAQHSGAIALRVAYYKKSAPVKHDHSSLAFGMIVLALAALLWSAPAGLRHWTLTSRPTQLYYAVLLVGGIPLLITGAWMFRAGGLNHKLIVAGLSAAALLAINQATGLTFDSILCTSAG